MSTTATTISREQDGARHSRWQPKWILDDPTLGVTMDDGCFVVLVRNHVREWNPTKHIPLTALASLMEVLSPDRLESE